MTLVWIGILVLAFSWLRVLPIYYAMPGSERWILIGVALIVFGLRNTVLWDDHHRKRVAAVVFVCSIVAMLWLSGPFRVGFLLLAVAAVLLWMSKFHAVGRWASPGLFASGMVYVIQAACVPLLYVFCARYHSTSELPFLHDMLPGYPAFPWLASFLYLPLKLLNPGTALDGSTLYIATALDTVPMTPTWEKLGLIPVTLFVAGVLFVSLLRPDWRKRIPGLLVCTAVFLYLRLLVKFLIVVQTRDEKIFWLFSPLFWSFVPLTFVLGAWWRMRSTPHQKHRARGDSHGGRWKRNRIVSWLSEGDRLVHDYPLRYRTARVLLATFLLAGGISAFFGFHDPGVSKAGRVLIDEGHSDWEWTTQPFDTTWYGGKSGYNYYCLADYWNHYYDVQTRTDSLTPAFLSQWDVVVIKTPTSSFAPEEVDAVVEYVRNGGGLFFIGDHTNVFGTSTYLNPIAERFGMYFRYDSTYDLRTMGLSLFERPARFAHPAVQFMPDYLFATSCTMYSPLLSENVILGYGLKAMYLDYSEISYFPTKEEKFNYGFGLFVQAGGVKFGKGRVLGYTDSTCFSNFFMFMPGKPELALASIEWLNRKNKLSWLRWVFLIASLIGLVLLVLEARRNSGASFWGVVISAGTLTIIAATTFAESAAKTAYALPKPHRPPVYVTFDQSHGNYNLPAERLPTVNWRNFQTFYVWTQRLGLVPRNENSVRDAVQDSRVLVEIQPVRPFSIDDIDRVVDFVRRGGTLVVLDSPENLGSTATTLLGPFNISFEGEPADSVSILNAQGDTLGVARSAVGVKNVRPILTLGDGRTVMGYMSFGKGKVVACGAAYIFSSEHMGNTAIEPNERQRLLFRAAYDIFEKTAGLKVESRYYEDRRRSQ
jgi:hypothetical protein